MKERAQNPLGNNKGGLNFGQDDAEDERELLSMMEGDRAKPPKAVLHEGG